MKMEDGEDQLHEPQVTDRGQPKTWSKQKQNCTVLTWRVCPMGPAHHEQWIVTCHDRTEVFWGGLHAMIQNTPKWSSIRLTKTQKICAWETLDCLIHSHCLPLNVSFSSFPAECHENTGRTSPSSPSSLATKLKNRWGRCAPTPSPRWKNLKKGTQRIFCDS